MVDQREAEEVGFDRLCSGMCITFDSRHILLIEGSICSYF